MPPTSDGLPPGDKLSAIRDVVLFRPVFSLGVVLLSLIAAVLEGVGLSFILPIIEQARGAPPGDPGGLMGLFTGAYRTLGIPFTLEFIILGVGAVIATRYTVSFLATWLRVVLQQAYARDLRDRSFEAALGAELAYFDDRGSDEILNAIITQTTHAAHIIRRIVRLLRLGLISLVYLSIAVYIAPLMTGIAILVLVLSTVLLRQLLEAGSNVGSRLADANEDLQTATQAGVQGIREVKLFGMESEILSSFRHSLDQYVAALVQQRRNSAGLSNFQKLVGALAVFGMVYVGLRLMSLSIGSLGVLLFAMFRLAPRVSNVNELYYNLEADLPHLVRAKSFIQEINERAESSGDVPAPDPVESVKFDNVSFDYGGVETVLQDVSFHAETNDFVAFVGQSGAGKSTIISLLARFYEPTEGMIFANGKPITDFDLDSWRRRIATVRQQPYIFNRSLRYNILIGDRHASSDEIQRVIEIARINEFLDDLPNGLDTILGDDGVRLSGGQKQRVAIARALLKDADVLLLDEATSDLDRKIEAEVQDAIASMERDYILITVAHRLSTVRDADRIYTISDGKISASGTHEELLDDSEEYANLYAS